MKFWCASSNSSKQRVSLLESRITSILTIDFHLENIK